MFNIQLWWGILLFTFSRYPCNSSTNPCYSSSLVFHVLNKYFSLPVILFSSITSLSRSIMTTRRLWSCAQRTPKTVTSGWLLLHRPGTFFAWPFTFKLDWQCPERKSDLRMCVSGEWKMQLNLRLYPFKKKKRKIDAVGNYSQFYSMLLRISFTSW